MDYIISGLPAYDAVTSCSPDGVIAGAPTRLSIHGLFFASSLKETYARVSIRCPMRTKQ
ncbi:MaoC family dehydratase [Roseibium sp. TrichSKD4]|nr:MaoC family dehydratase [Roseibium sp. TrichSKD4]